MHRLLILALVISLFASPPAARGQLQLLNNGSEAEATPTVALTAESLAGRRAEVRSEADEARKLAATAGDGLREIIAQRVESLERLDLMLGQQATAIKEIAEANQAHDVARESLTKLRAAGLPEEGPFPLLEVDALRDDLDAALRRESTLTAGVEAANAALTQAKKLRDQRNKERRSARERLDEAEGPVQETERQQAYLAAEAASRLAEELVVLRSLESRRERALVERHETQSAYQRELLRRMAPDTVFTQEALTKQLELLEAREKQLTTSLQTATRAADLAEQRWSKDRQRLELSVSSDAVLGEEVEASRRAYTTKQQSTVVLQNRLQRTADERRIWVHRFALATNAATPANAIAWKKEVEQLVLQARREEEVQLARLADLRKEALALNERLAWTPGNDASLRHLRHQRDSIQELLDVYEENLNALSRILRVYKRFSEELGRNADDRTARERLEAGWARVQAFWTYELTTVDDESITVGKLIVVLLMLTLGLRIARLLSHAVGQRMLPKLGVPPSAATAFESVIYYITVVFVVLFALNTVNIPLTAFTILGGALAIGIGFGSQNIVSNFISSLILLAERPISTGDLVEVDNILGTIEAIGARSTRVRTFENTHYLIPNSYFLENRFVNWTLSDDIVRSKVVVGVAYGSPTRRVEELLLRAPKGVTHVQPWPEPWVRFTEFGDNALTFELMCYVRPLLQKWSVETALRHRINELFDEAGIVIAFPQRDIHLDTTSPLDIRVQPAPPDPGSEAS